MNDFLVIYSGLHLRVQVKGAEWNADNAEFFNSSSASRRGAYSMPGAANLTKVGTVIKLRLRLRRCALQGKGTRSASIGDPHPHNPDPQGLKQHRFGLNQ
jgi:hypothetical protein